MVSISPSPIFCHLCDKFKIGDLTTKIVHHHDLIPIQRGKYMIEKQKIGEGDIETILITQDFTQLDLTRGFVQDLIICCY